MGMMAPGKIWPGTDVKVSAVFKDENGAVVDPDAITFMTYGPCGGLSSGYVYGTHPSVVRTAAGKYYAKVNPVEPGRWFYRWVTQTIVDDAVVATCAEEGSFIVQVSPFPIAVFPVVGDVPIPGGSDGDLMMWGPGDYIMWGPGDYLIWS